MAHLANLRYPRTNHDPDDFLPEDLREVPPDDDAPKQKRDLRTLMD